MAVPAINISITQVNKQQAVRTNNAMECWHNAFYNIFFAVNNEVFTFLGALIK
jgi:hypothetical protein